MLPSFTDLGSSIKAYANGRNKLQHCCVFFFGWGGGEGGGGRVGQQCCVRLRGPKSLTGFKLYATSANKCQHCCGFMQTDATCSTQQRCVLLANKFASLCIGLKGITVGCPPPPGDAALKNFPCKKVSHAFEEDLRNFRAFAN